MADADIAAVSNADRVIHHATPDPLPLVPGPWDEIIAQATLKAADWVHDRLSRRVPTLASAPLPADPARRLLELGGMTRGRGANQETDERGGDHPP